MIEKSFFGMFSVKYIFGHFLHMFCFFIVFFLLAAFVNARASLASSPIRAMLIALCGYPLVKVPVEKIWLFAPILLRFDYFRQNIWRLLSTQFHF